MVDFAYIGAALVFFVARASLRDSLRTVVRRSMTLDLWLGAFVTVGILVYLVYALIRPERF